MKHFRFTLDDPKAFSFRAGQFLMLHAPVGPEGLIRRAYSICSPPHDQGAVELVVKFVEKGLVTPWLFGLKQGASVNVDGPYGAFLLPKTLPKELVFVGTGTGIAPFRSQIETLFRQGCPAAITLLFGVRYEDEILYRQRWDELEKARPNFRFVPTISRPRHLPVPWTGEVGYVQTKLAGCVKPGPEKALMICGLWDMIQAVEKTCLEMGFAKSQIHYERYD
ncbi:MAG: FAD-dependent oxidoreductase [Candidatus Omnitrophica bacterium]|nr:FAD-dependent oxidoreductase [Candidatus Omnitrophota bacterium]